MAKRKRNKKGLWNTFLKIWKDPEVKREFTTRYIFTIGIPRDRYEVRKAAYQKLKEFARDSVTPLNLTNKEFQSRKYTKEEVSKFLNRVKNSKTFSSDELRLKSFFLEDIKKDKEFLKEIRKEYGWKKKIDDIELTYVSSEGKKDIYSFTNKDGETRYIVRQKSPNEDMMATLGLYVDIGLEDIKFSGGYQVE